MASKPKLRGKATKLDVDKIRPNPWNPNVQDAFMYDRQKASIHTYGFAQPIIVRLAADGEYEIIDGEHRWRAAKELGMKQIPAWDLGKVTDTEAKQLVEVFIHLRGNPDLVAEAKLIRSLVDEDGLSVDVLAESLPFTTDQLGDLYKSLDFDWDQYKVPPPPDASGGEEGEDSPAGDTATHPQAVVPSTGGEQAAPAEVDDVAAEELVRELTTLPPDRVAGIMAALAEAGWLVVRGFTADEVAEVQAVLQAAGPAGDTTAGLLRVCRAFADSEGK